MRFNGVDTLNICDLSLDLEVPGLIAITGVAGSGKSALLIHTIYEESLRALAPGLSFDARRRLARPLFSQVQNVEQLRATINIGEVVASYSENPQTIEDTMGLKPLLHQIAYILGTPACEKPNCGLELADASSVVSKLVEEISSDDILELLLIGATVPLLAEGETKKHKNSERKQALESAAGMLCFFIGEGYRRFIVSGVYFRFDEAERNTILAELKARLPIEPLDSISIIITSVPLKGETVFELRERIISELEEVFSAGMSRCFVLAVRSQASLRSGDLLVDKDVGFYRQVLNGYHCRFCNRTISRQDFSQMAATEDRPNPKVQQRTSKKSGAFSAANQKFPLHFYLNGLDLQTLRSSSVESVRQHLASVLSRSAQAAPWVQKAVSLLAQLSEWGLKDLPLNRPVEQLSSGEQVKLACAIFAPAETSDVVFVFDEPSRILHPRDLEDFLRWAKAQNRAGNGVIVAEQNPEFIAAADDVLELGPGGGRKGGRLVFRGSGQEWAQSSSRGKSAVRRTVLNDSRVKRAQSIRINDFEFPLQSLLAIVGPAGAGKTRWLREIEATCSARGSKELRAIYLGAAALTALRKPLRAGQRLPLVIDTAKLLEKVASIFAQLPLARRAGFSSDSFSLSEAVSRCPECHGAGFVFEGADFIGAGVEECSVCGGRRFDERVLSCVMNEQSILDVFSMSAQEALSLFSVYPEIVASLQLFIEIGVGELRLGTPIEFLSVTDRQRLALIENLAMKTAAKKLLLLDQTLAGLDAEAVQSAMRSLHRFIERGGSVAIATHDPQVVLGASSVVEIAAGAVDNFYLRSSEYPLDYFSFLREVRGP